MSNLLWRTFVRGVCNVLGLDSPYSSDSYGLNWSKQRQKCLERDDYQCRVCSTNTDELDREPSVHHIRPRSEFDESDWAEYNDLSNLITLCPSCHGKLEGKYTDADPDEFVRKAQQDNI